MTLDQLIIKLMQIRQEVGPEAEVWHKMFGDYDNVDFISLETEDEATRVVLV